MTPQTFAELRSDDSHGTRPLIEIHYLFDSGFPNGSFSQSFGLETMINRTDIIDLEKTYEWIERFMTLSLWHGDLEVLTRSFELEINHASSGYIVELDTALYASRATQEARSGASSVASATLRAIKLLFMSNPDPLWATLQEASTLIGLLAAHRSWEIGAVRSLFLSTYGQLLTSVLVRSGRIGQNKQLELIPAIWASAVRLSQIRPSSDLPAIPSQCFELDRDQALHVNLSPRLFQT